jgi:hypothetical protein
MLRPNLYTNFPPNWTSSQVDFRRTSRYLPVEVTSIAKFFLLEIQIQQSSDMPTGPSRELDDKRQRLLPWCPRCPRQKGLRRSCCEVSGRHRWRYPGWRVKKTWDREHKLHIASRVFQPDNKISYDRAIWYATGSDVDLLCAMRRAGWVKQSSLSLSWMPGTLASRYPLGQGEKKSCVTSPKVVAGHKENRRKSVEERRIVGTCVPIPTVYSVRAELLSINDVVSYFDISLNYAYLCCPSFSARGEGGSICRPIHTAADLRIPSSLGSRTHNPTSCSVTSACLTPM